jgi:hypothetical protein
LEEYSYLALASVFIEKNILVQAQSIAATAAIALE